MGADVDGDDGHESEGGVREVQTDVGHGLCVGVHGLGEVTDWQI